MLVAIAAAPWPLGYFDAIYGVTSLILGAAMLVLAIHVYRRRERDESLRATRRLFGFSILICSRCSRRCCSKSPHAPSHL